MTEATPKLEIGYDAQGRILPPTFRTPAENGHKYDRGHVGVVSGPVLATGASRLSAGAALAMGAGLVTLYGENDALHEHAAHVTAIMLAGVAGLAKGEGRRVDAAVIGPGHGGGDNTLKTVLALLEKGMPIVLDADALTAFADDPESLFAACHDKTVLTPHEGEFSRTFPDLNEGDRIARCQKAADRVGATVLLKGARAVITAPGGRFAVNEHASPVLATAGSGDVLSGMIGGLLGQGADPFDAACAAVWCHGDIGVRFGPGLTADRMAGVIPVVLAARTEEEGKGGRIGFLA